MILPDAHQDVLVFGANALTNLILDNPINLSKIARIYVGPKSAIDSSKPVCSIIIALMEQKFGENCIENCDAVNFTFACIRSVDTLQNCLNFVRLRPDKKQLL